MVLNSISNRIKIEKLKKTILPVLKQNDVMRAGIFGSSARGELKRGSDIDLLVQLRKNKSLLDLIGLQLDLEKKLNKKVDVVTYDSLNPLLKERILKDEVRIK